AAFEQRADIARLRLSREARELAALYEEVGAWFADQASRHGIVDHTDRVFVEVTLLGESRRYQQKAADLLRDAEREVTDENLLRCAYRRLASRFEVTVRTFERKRYANLSHEPNKAMNLNTYIALMGGRFLSGPTGLDACWRAPARTSGGSTSTTVIMWSFWMPTRSCIRSTS